MKKILVLGSTGSIGTQTLDVIRENQDNFQITGLVCGSSTEALKKQINEFQPKVAGIFNKNAKIKTSTKTKIYYGEENILKLIKQTECDLIVVAITGAAGLKPALAAIQSGKDVALATKEVMVLAGEQFVKEIKRRKLELFPIDSEHSAIWQSLRSGSQKEIEKIFLTCSGGPFKKKKTNELINVTPLQALGHPTWKMGKKITIDSSTLMNKGFEVIEAKWLFDISVNQIEVVIHPESILHSAVMFIDGSVIGQMSLPDMRIPIQYALSYPKRLKTKLPRLSLTDLSNLSFFKPDLKTFPCLTYAYEAIDKGGTMPTVLNAVDEIAVGLFLNQKIKFLDIPKIIRKTMDVHKIIKSPDFEQILIVDFWARSKAMEIYENKKYEN